MRKVVSVLSPSPAQSGSSFFIILSIVQDNNSNKKKHSHSSSSKSRNGNGNKNNKTTITAITTNIKTAFIVIVFVDGLKV